VGEGGGGGEHRSGVFKKGRADINKMSQHVKTEKNIKGGGNGGKSEVGLLSTPKEEGPKRHQWRQVRQKNRKVERIKSYGWARLLVHRGNAEKVMQT